MPCQTTNRGVAQPWRLARSRSTSTSSRRLASDLVRAAIHASRLANRSSFFSPRSSSSGKGGHGPQVLLGLEGEHQRVPEEGVHTPRPEPPEAPDAHPPLSSCAILGRGV